MQARPPSSRVHERSSRAHERAELLFALYVELGPERSLVRLQDQLASIDIGVSLSSLKRYSTRHSWPQRMAVLEEQAVRRREGGHLKQALALYDRQVQLGRALQGAGGAALRSLMADDARLRELKPAEIARLLELGLKAEREASVGNADRRRLALAMANLVTQEVAALFERINGINDDGNRARRFAEGLDALVDEHLRQEEVS